MRIESNDLSYRGKSTIEFERILSDYIGAYIVCTNTGTSALHLALILAGIKRNDIVLCPSITYVATANVITYCGAIPFFIDVKDDLTIDTEKLDKYLEQNSLNNLKAIMPVHVLGKPCDMRGIKRIARKYKLKIIEDACQSLGSFYYGQHTGTIGDFGAISFNGNKIITTGGGGALITKSKRMYEKALHLSVVARIGGEQALHDQIAYNYRMPSWNAKLGLIQFDGCKKLQILKEKSKSQDIVNNEWMSIDRTGKKIWKPLHQLKMYKDNPRMDCANAEMIGRDIRIK